MVLSSSQDDHFLTGEDHEAQVSHKDVLSWQTPALQPNMHTLHVHSAEHIKHGLVIWKHLLFLGAHGEQIGQMPCIKQTGWMSCMKQASCTPA